MISTFTQPQTQKSGFGNISICYLAEATVFQDIYRNLEQQVSCEVHSDLLKGQIGLIFPASKVLTKHYHCLMTSLHFQYSYVSTTGMMCSNLQRRSTALRMRKETQQTGVYGVRFDVLVESEKEIQDSILVRCYSKTEINC